MYNVSGVSFNGGAESTGSAARKVRGIYECPPEQSECDTINFKEIKCPLEQPDCDTVNFKGNDYPYYTEPKKKMSPVLRFTLWLIGAAGVVGRLGYAHKSGIINKLKEGAFRDKFAEPVTNKCHEWCAWTKNKGYEVLSKLKNIGKKG